MTGRFASYPPMQPTPLVTGIMPCRGRVELAQMSLRCFNSQDYQNKELIVLDDADEPAFPNGISQHHITYQRLEERLSIGDKRNRCCELATGEIIQHYDSDDWSNTGRMSDQVQRLLANPTAAMTTYNRMVFADTITHKAYMLVSSKCGTGTSMCYWRSWWDSHRFKDLQIGEDTTLMRQASAEGKLITVAAEQHQVSLLHDSHTWRRNLKSSIWTPCDYPTWMHEST